MHFLLKNQIISDVSGTANPSPGFVCAAGSSRTRSFFVATLQQLQLAGRTWRARDRTLNILNYFILLHVLYLWLVYVFFNVLQAGHCLIMAQHPAANISYNFDGAGAGSRNVS